MGYFMNNVRYKDNGMIDYRHADILTIFVL